MAETKVWSDDTCTCEHKVSQHPDGGPCIVCHDEKSWGQRRVACPRYQWNGEARRRTW